MEDIFGIEQNPKLGYYKVGDRIFYSKPQALIYATETKQFPKYFFNNEVYGKQDWAHEPETNLRELYRLRAQQLRDKYDWLRLECSGGSDSTTVAFSFLLNGIHLDEVIFRYPKTGDKGVTDNVTDTNATNTLSEFQFAAKPLLEWIKTNFPKTIVRIHDFAANMLEEENSRDESWVFNTRDWLQPAHGDKYNQFSVPEHRVLADSGKRIGVISGIEKPRMCIIDNAYYCYFQDLHANSAHPKVGDYTNITNEYFYWTPDFPEIPVKQAHMIRTWFEMPQNSQLRHLIQWPNTSVSKRTAYEQIAKSIIYPDYDQQTWQTIKPTNSFYNEMDHWFYTNFKDTKLFGAWQAGLKFLTDKIDPLYFTFQSGQMTGFNAFVGTFYYLGDSVPQGAGPKFTNRAYQKSNDLPLIKNQKLTIRKF